MLKLRYIPAMLCLALFATLGVLALLDNKPPTQDNLYAPNLTYRTRVLPCPPFCEHALKTFVKASEKDTGIVGRRVYPHWQDATIVSIPCPGCHPGGLRPCAPFCVETPSLSEEVHDAWLAGLIETKGSKMGFTW